MAYEAHSPTARAPIIDETGISDQTISIFTWIVIAVLCQAIDIFGIATNIISIMCFVKQGFREPVNITLLGLAFADLGCLVTQVFLNIFYTLEVSTTDLAFDATDVAYLTLGVPHLAFSRVNNWITAIIILERCLCITVPLKMKYIVTPNRVWILISCVYIVFIFSGAPVFAVYRLSTKFSLLKNRTIFGLVFTEDKDKYERITLTINSFLLPFLAFITVIICTIILVVNLRKRTRWLKSAAQADLTLRDQKVAKMVVMISVLFIVCFVPLAAIMLAVAFEPNLNVGGKLFYIGRSFGFIALLMESMNSSVNIFIYYRMSNKYRETFHIIFCRSNYKPSSKE